MHPVIPSKLTLSKYITLVGSRNRVKSGRVKELVKNIQSGMVSLKKEEEEERRRRGNGGKKRGRGRGRGNWEGKSGERGEEMGRGSNCEV